MSLAMFAASVDDAESPFASGAANHSSTNLLHQKRHKRTQRKYPKIENFDTAGTAPSAALFAAPPSSFPSSSSSSSSSSSLRQLHQSSSSDDDEPHAFVPPPKPMSVGAQRMQTGTAGSSTTGTESFQVIGGRSPEQGANDYADNYGTDASRDEYFRKVLPGYQPQQQQQQPRANGGGYSQPMQLQDEEYPTQAALLKKINYVISLLEEQQDDRTDNVTEEVILYSFLGIFIIFVADTFMRVGKYTR